MNTIQGSGIKTRTRNLVYNRINQVIVSTCAPCSWTSRREWVTYRHTRASITGSVELIPVCFDRQWRACMKIGQERWHRNYGQMLHMFCMQTPIYLFCVAEWKLDCWFVIWILECHSLLAFCCLVMRCVYNRPSNINTSWKYVKHFDTLTGLFRLKSTQLTLVKIL